jgi:hypothetical protein
VIQFRVKSDRAQTVTGLGVFTEGEERLMTVEEVASFFQINGVPPHPDNLPAGLTIEAEATPDEDGEEASDA